MHVHTNHSKDGRSSVKEVLEAAIRAGLDAIAITDHDTVSGSLEALEIVRDEHMRIKVITGIEVSTSDGHLLVYGVKKDIDPGMSMIETVRTARKLGGLSAIAHPFQFYRHGCVKFWFAKYVDAVEVLNAKYVFGICNRISRIIARHYGKPGIAGSDAHSAGEVGKAVTVIRGSELFEQILKGNTEVRGSRQSLLSWPRIARLKVF